MRDTHLFGPVPSRRLGLSLGVDIVPVKTCSLDCIYCQLGKTTEKTIERKDYVPIEEVLAELRKRLAQELLSRALNTRSKRILQEFKLEDSGGFKIGDFKKGVTGKAQDSCTCLI